MHKINIRNGKPNAVHKRGRDRAAVKKLRTFLRYSYDDQWRPIPDHSPLWFFWAFRTVCHLKKGGIVVRGQWGILTLETFEELKSEIHADGMKRIHVGPGHMASYITAVFICDTCDEDARKSLKKCRIYKSFHFSLHGWMNFHAALVEVADGKVTSNASGHHVAKILKKVLYDTRGKRS